MTLFLLFGFLFAILAAVGYYFDLSGYLIVLLAVALVFFQWLIGPSVIWWTTNMRLLNKNEYPWLWETVKELCKKTNTPIPKLAIARVGEPNAFTFGRTSGSATLVVTEGLLHLLGKEEIKAVVAHEVGHINHKDMVVMTVVSAIPIVTYFVARFLLFVPQRDERGKGGAAILVGLAAFVIYFISNLLVLALSRLREYYSDRFSGENMKPSLLAGALAKITYGLSMDKNKENSAVRSFFIADPITAVSEVSALPSQYSDLKLSEKELKDAMEWEKRNPFIRFSELFRTHPLTYKRIVALKEMEKGVAE
jgi:heat shock protein HtpX